MKIKYHQRHNHQRRFSQALLIILVLSLLVAAVYGAGLMAGTVRTVYSTAQSAKHTIEQLTKNAFTAATPKATIVQANQELRTRLQELEVAALYSHTLELENGQLRALLGAATSTMAQTKKTLVRVIDHNNAPYGTLLVKTMSDTTVTVGDTAHRGSWAIGKVVQSNGRVALIKLFTGSGEAYDILVGGVSGTFVGESNGTGVIHLSRTKDIAIGTPVALPSAQGFILATVIITERDVEESMQTVRVRTPYNIDSLQFLTISSL